MPAMRPCTWNSGMTRSERSAAVSSYVSLMFARLAARLACVSGTPLGFDVVPAPPVSTPLCRGNTAAVSACRRLR